MAVAIPSVTLNDGVSIPVYGFGTFLLPNDGTTYKAVRAALELGIRHIDTATAYFNEEETGRAIRDSGIPREEIFVTSKLWLQDYAFADACKAVDTSLRKLGLDYIDLYLVHQPYGDVPSAWKALEQAKAAGKLRSIGVSNMTVKIWQQFVPYFNSLPSVNQIEYHPFKQELPVRALMDKAGVRLESWGPLGFGDKKLLQHPVIQAIARAHGKDTAQVILRFEVQEGAIVFPKSSRPERIASNMQIFDFALTEAEIQQMRALNTETGRHDPDAPGVAEMLLRSFDVHKDDKD